MQMHTYQPAHLHALTRCLFEASGATPDIADIVAKIPGECQSRRSRFSRRSPHPYVSH